MVIKYLMVAFILLSIELTGCSYSQPKKALFPVATEETDQPKISQEKTVTEDINYVVMEGEQGIILRNTPYAIGFSKENFDEFMSYFDAKDLKSISKMGENKVADMQANTLITVIKNDGRGVEVKINETGEIGWVPVEFVGKIK